MLLIVKVNRSIENINLLSVDVVMSSFELLVNRIHCMFDISTTGDALSIVNLNIVDLLIIPNTESSIAITVGGTIYTNNYNNRTN